MKYKAIFAQLALLLGLCTSQFSIAQSTSPATRPTAAPQQIDRAAVKAALESVRDILQTALEIGDIPKRPTFKEFLPTDQGPALVARIDAQIKLLEGDEAGAIALSRNVNPRNPTDGMMDLALCAALVGDIKSAAKFADSIGETVASGEKPSQSLAYDRIACIVYQSQDRRAIAEMVDRLKTFLANWTVTADQAAEQQIHRDMEAQLRVLEAIVEGRDEVVSLDYLPPDKKRPRVEFSEGAVAALQTNGNGGQNMYGSMARAVRRAMVRGVADTMPDSETNRLLNIATVQGSEFIGDTAGALATARRTESGWAQRDPWRQSDFCRIAARTGDVAWALSHAARITDEKIRIDCLVGAYLATSMSRGTEAAGPIGDAWIDFLEKHPDDPVVNESLVGRGWIELQHQLRDIPDQLNMFDRLVAFEMARRDRLIRQGILHALRPPGPLVYESRVRQPGQPTDAEIAAINGRQWQFTVSENLEIIARHAVLLGRPELARSWLRKAAVTDIAAEQYPQVPAAVLARTGRSLPRVPTLLTMAKEQDNVDDVEGAIFTCRYAMAFYPVDSVRQELLDLLLKAGLFKDALALQPAFSTAELRVTALGRIAAAQTAASDDAGAAKTAALIEGSTDAVGAKTLAKCLVLAAQAQAQFNAGKGDEALRLAGQAIDQCRATANIDCHEAANAALVVQIEAGQGAAAFAALRGLYSTDSGHSHAGPEGEDTPDPEPIGMLVPIPLPPGTISFGRTRRGAAGASATAQTADQQTIQLAAIAERLVVDGKYTDAKAVIEQIPLEKRANALLSCGELARRKLSAGNTSEPAQFFIAIMTYLSRIPDDFAPDWPLIKRFDARLVALGDTARAETAMRGAVWLMSFAHSNLADETEWTDAVNDRLRRGESGDALALISAMPKGMRKSQLLVLLAEDAFRGIFEEGKVAPLAPSPALAARQWMPF